MLACACFDRKNASASDDDIVTDILYFCASQEEIQNSHVLCCCVVILFNLKIDVKWSEMSVQEELVVGDNTWWQSSTRSSVW